MIRGATARIAGLGQEKGNRSGMQIEGMDKPFGKAWLIAAQ